MNSDCFRVLRQRLMEKLDLARELSDEEILEEIDDLLLNGKQEEALSPWERWHCAAMTERARMFIFFINENRRA